MQTAINVCPVYTSIKYKQMAKKKEIAQLKKMRACIYPFELRQNRQQQLPPHPRPSVSPLVLSIN